MHWSELVEDAQRTRVRMAVIMSSALAFSCKAPAPPPSEVESVPSPDAPPEVRPAVGDAALPTPETKPQGCIFGAIYDRDKAAGCEPQMEIGTVYLGEFEGPGVGDVPITVDDLRANTDLLKMGAGFYCPPNFTSTLGDSVTPRGDKFPGYCRTPKTEHEHEVMRAYWVAVARRNRKAPIIR